MLRVQRPSSQFFCLASGIGASAISFTLAEATVLRPFALEDANSLVLLWESDSARPADLGEISLLKPRDWERHTTTFSSMAAFGSSRRPGTARVRGESFSIAPAV